MKTWYICTILAISSILFYKAWVANDVHTTLAQDPMQNWLAIGIAALLLHSLRRPS